MKFFHVYNEKYFEGLVKNGLINEESGFKIQHVFALDENMKFNCLAAKGTKLHSFIKEGNYPFYVDRIAGGVTYHKYRFDKALIHEYRELLGDWFLGFQLHESGNNRALDWQRVFERMEGSKGPYDAKILASRSIREHAVTPAGEVLFGFSQGSPEEYAALRYPETAEAFVEEMTGLFRRRMDETEGIILPCDSYHLFTKIQNDLGMNTFMPEVGCQIPHMRIAVALARGMALASHKRWGVYYECWRATPGVGYTMPCFNKEPGNEWYLTQQTHKDDFTSYGPNGGSSRLLQKRIYYYALMSGARYVAEEWGLNCSYSNMNTFELSEYGEVKKEFIDYTLGYRNIEARIPFAIVLPCDYPCIQLTSEWGKVGQWRTQFLGRDMTAAQVRHHGKIEDLLKTIFVRSEEDACGNEGHVLQNSRFGDLFDIIYEDAFEEALAKYDYLIDATDGESFAAQWNDRFKLLDSSDVETLAAQLERITKETLPCTVDALHWMLSEDEKGRYVTIFNNEGNERDLDRGNIIHHEADAVVKVSLKEPSKLHCIKCSCDNVKISKLDETTYCVEIPAAEFVILQY